MQATSVCSQAPGGDHSHFVVISRSLNSESWLYLVANVAFISCELEALIWETQSLQFSTFPRSKFHIRFSATHVFPGISNSIVAFPLACAQDMLKVEPAFVCAISQCSASSQGAILPGVVGFTRHGLRRRCCIHSMWKVEIPAAIVTPVIRLRRTVIRTPPEVTDRLGGRLPSRMSRRPVTTVTATCHVGCRDVRQVSRSHKPPGGRRSVRRSGA